MIHTPDVIRKEITLRANLPKVWRAISDADEFGQWFGVRFDGPFEAGKSMTGHITPTVVNDEIAAHQKPYEGMPFAMVVEAIEPQTLFAFRWHPYAIDKDKDYSAEPMTLVSFALNEVEGGVHLTITESGFDKIPLMRRAEAFRMNDGGWQAQAGLIEAWLAR